MAMAHKTLMTIRFNKEEVLLGTHEAVHALPKRRPCGYRQSSNG
jgi:hypothetical protein